MTLRHELRPSDFKYHALSTMKHQLQILWGIWGGSICNVIDMFSYRCLWAPTLPSLSLQINHGSWKVKWNFTTTGNDNYLYHLILEEPGTQSPQTDVVQKNLLDAKIDRPNYWPFGLIQFILSVVECAGWWKENTHVISIRAVCLLEVFFKGHCLKGSHLWERMHEISVEIFKPVTFRHQMIFESSLSASVSIFAPFSLLSDSPRYFTRGRKRVFK